MSDLEAVKRVLPTTPVLANTGVKHDTVADVLRVADGVIVGSALKVRRRHLVRRGSRPRQGLHGPRARDAGCGMTLRDAASQELMLIPGLAGYEDRVAAAVAAHLDAPGAGPPLGPAGQPDRHHRRATRRRRRVMVFAHMDQLGLIVRKIEASGPHPGGAPGRRARTRAAGPGRPPVHGAGDLPGVIANKSHHATTPEEKFQVVPYAELYVDAGFASKAEAEAAGVRIGTPVIYLPRVLDAGERPHRRHRRRRPRGLRGAARAGGSAARQARARRCTSSGRCRRSTTCAGVLPAATVAGPGHRHPAST